MRIVWKKEALQDLDRIEYFLLIEVKLDEAIIATIINKLHNAPKKLLQFPRMGHN